MRGTTNSSYRTKKVIMPVINIVDDSIDGNIILFAGGTYQVQWEVTPAEAGQAVTFSLDLDGVSIDANGLITADASFGDNLTVAASLTLTLVSNKRVTATAPYLVRRSPTPTYMNVYGVSDMTVNRSGYRMTVSSQPTAAPANSNIVLSDDTMATITSIEPEGYTNGVVSVYYKTLNKIGMFTATATNKYYPVSQVSSSLNVHPEPTGLYFENPTFTIVINDGVGRPTPVHRVQPFIDAYAGYNNAIQTTTSESLTPNILELGDDAVVPAFYAIALGQGTIEYTSVENTSIKNTVSVSVVPITSFEVSSARNRNSSSASDEYIYQMTAIESFPISIPVFDLKINGSSPVYPSSRLYNITTTSSKIYPLYRLDQAMRITDYIQNEVVTVTYKDNTSYTGTVKVTVLPYS